MTKQGVCRTILHNICGKCQTSKGLWDVCPVCQDHSPITVRDDYMSNFMKDRNAKRIADYVRWGLTQEQAENWVVNHVRPEGDVLRKSQKNRDKEVELETAQNLANYKVDPETELNIKVAEKVFGHKVAHNHWNRGRTHSYTVGEPDYYDDQGEMKLFNPLPRYTTDIRAAWEVVDHIKGVWDISSCSDFWLVKLAVRQGSYSDLFVSAEADTVQKAICLVAVKAMESMNG